MCYTIPAVTSIVTTIVWRKSKDAKIWWLNLMLYGGAIFGVIDHLYNGELFLISENLIKDLFLGCLITAAIFTGWIISLALARVNPVIASYLRIHGKAS